MIEWKPFSAKALDFLANSTARLNILHGSVRSSKTINCTVRWLTYIANGPKGDLAMLGKTMATLQRNVLNDMFDIVGKGNFKWINRQQGELIIYNRRVYCFGANNEDAESKLRGATFAGSLCDEVNLYPQSVFNQLMARMSVAGAQCFCNCNPDSPYHWFYTDYIQNDRIKDKKIWHFTMDDNLSLDQSYRESLEQMYRGVWYDRMILGLWVAAEGRIYDMFDTNEHVVDTKAVLQEAINAGIHPAAIRYYVACDYGTSTVMTWGLYARLPLPDNRVLKLAEYYYDAQEKKVQKTDHDFANEFDRWLKIVLPEGWPTYIYCDPSAASWKAELRQRGYIVIDANNDVLNGIREVATQLSTHRYLIDKSCVNTVKEYQNYVWDERYQKLGIDKPLKTHDHTCLTGDTLVWTEQGRIPIQDLVGTEGKCVCYDFETDQWVTEDFFNVHQTAVSADIYEVELTDGSILRGTADHKVFTSEGWKTIGELTQNDCVGVYSTPFGYVRIASVKTAGGAPVYNMTVEKHHNYVVNEGILVKNCDTDRYFIYTNDLYKMSGVYN